MELLFIVMMGKPLWMWLGFLSLVVVLLALDLGIFNRKDHEIGVRESLALSAFYIVMGLAYGGFVWWLLGPRSGVEYLTGFLVEKSLAMDNLFVIALIFSFLAIPRKYQHRVLFWGILGVIVLRGIMIGLGAKLVNEYEWVLLVFAAFLIFTGIRMLWLDTDETDLSENRLLKFLKSRCKVTPELHGDRFFVRVPDPRTGRLTLFATPLFLALVMIEVADVIFAVDSVPAIFAITTDPFIVYTSNIFAILGLRALFFALSAVIHRFAYLKQALALLLIFIGGKVFFAEAMGWEKVPPEWSLAVTFVILAGGIAYSLWRTRRDEAIALDGADAKGAGRS